MIVDEVPEKLEYCSRPCSATYLMRSHICGHVDGLWPMGRSLPLILNGSEQGETRLPGWRRRMSFHSARMGPIQANHFGNPHFSQRGAYRTTLEDFTAVSKLPSDTVQMIPALTGWIAAYGIKNRYSGSNRF